MKQGIIPVFLPLDLMLWPTDLELPGPWFLRVEDEGGRCGPFGPRCFSEVFSGALPSGLVSGWASRHSGLSPAASRPRPPVLGSLEPSPGLLPSPAAAWAETRPGCPARLFLWEISGVGPQMAGGCLRAPSAGVGVRTTRDAGWHLPDTGAGRVLRGGSQAGLTRVALLSSAHLPDPAEGARLQASLICPLVPSCSWWETESLLLNLRGLGCLPFPKAGRQ